MKKSSQTIWFDFDNAPHVPVLLPIVREMRNRGFKTVLTARDKAETKDLMLLENEKFKVIGKLFPKNKVLKLFLTIKRAIHLIFFIEKDARIKPIISVSHSSRSALLASWIKRIPSLFALR